MTPSSWAPVSPAAARSLADARRQLHHAAQLATAFGISFLPPRGDDSHTNLEWLPETGALASNALHDVRVALRVAELTLELQVPRAARNGGDAGSALFPLTGRTLEDGAAWIRERLAAARLDRSRYTLARHYEIPPHAVASGAAFDADAAALDELARWFGNAAALFERLRAGNPTASEVRCWPHHFDIATLMTIAPGRTVGVGLEPGDAYYDEPYFYVNMHPSPRADALTTQPPGGGSWHTREWIGAVLPGSRLVEGAHAQEGQARAFLDGAIRLATELVRG